MFTFLKVCKVKKILFFNQIKMTTKIKYGNVVGNLPSNCNPEYDNLQSQVWAESQNNPYIIQTFPNIDDNQYTYNNYKLYGGDGHPRTKVAPIVAGPILDKEFWRYTTLSDYDIINRMRSKYPTESGYLIKNPPCKLENQNLNKIKYKSLYVLKDNDNDDDNKIYNSNQLNINSEPFTDSIDSYSNQNNTRKSNNGPNIFNPKNDNRNFYIDCEETQYDIDNPDHELINMQKRPFTNNLEYNKQLNTATLQPGVYVNNESYEPQLSNLGISVVPQFLPLLHTKDEYGNEIITQTQLPVTEDYKSFVDSQRNLNQNSVYDPRTDGYASNNRLYVEQNLGQPRWYYKDIDMVRNNGDFWTRNNIDHLPYAPTKGYVTDSSKDQDVYMQDNFHSLVDTSYINSTTDYRTELQERLMRKNNDRIVEMRKYPIITNKK